MVLLITNRQDVTTDFVVNRLNEKGIGYYRLNTEDIISSIDINFDFHGSNFFLFDKKKQKFIEMPEVESVYFRRPKLPNIYDKSLSNGENEFVLNEISYTLEGLYKILDKKFWISPVSSIRNAENKIYQLILARKMGFEIPVSLISTIKENVELFIMKNKDCVIKPIKTGFINDDKAPKIVFTNVMKKEQKESLSRVKYCPTFFQNKVEKKADIRVTVVGNKLFSAAITTQNKDAHKTDWRQEPVELLHYEKFDLPNSLRKKCVDLTKNLGLNFGAIDLILDKKNRFIFLEINPNGQWAWIEKRLGYNISGEIVNLLLQEGEEGEI